MSSYKTDRENLVRCKQKKTDHRERRQKKNIARYFVIKTLETCEKCIDRIFQN